MPRPRPVHRRQSPLSRRLGYYALGLAIGIVLVGFLLSVRALMVQPAPGPQPPAPAGSP